MMINHPRFGTWLYWGIMAAVVVSLALMNWAVRAQAPSPPIYPSLPPPLPLTTLPDYVTPGPTYILPPPPPPRVDYPPLYVPSAPIVICTRYGTGTVCQ